MFNRNCFMRNNGPMMNYNNCMDRQPIMEQQVMEPTMTNCVEREFYHEIPHCCPMHTHIVNKHIYTHTYTPQYSCSEENVVVNNDCGGCPGFMNR